MNTLDKPLQLNEMRVMKESNYQKFRSILSDPALMGDEVLAEVGRRLKAMMQNLRYNTTNQWVAYVDRDFLSLDRRAAVNPWDLDT